jgi:hypothetical protein
VLGAGRLSVLKGSDDGVVHLEESCFWTLSIVQRFFFKKKQRFGNWLCFRLRVKKGGGGVAPEGAVSKTLFFKQKTLDDG